MPTSDGPDPLAVEGKIVLVLSPDLAPGQMANRAAVLATGLTARHPEIVGADTPTLDGTPLPGITKVPIAVLRAPEAEALPILSAKARSLACTTLVYLSRAQGLRSYAEYERSISHTPTGALDVEAFIAYGPKKKISKVTGSLPLLR
jgi:hypothetical protein